MPAMRAKSLKNSVAARVAMSVALAVPLVGGPKQAGADEIQLLSAASMQTVLNEIISDFERTSGHKLIIRYSMMGAITERVMGGEEADLISSPTSISTLAARGKINIGSLVAIARTGVWDRGLFGRAEASDRLRRGFQARPASSESHRLCQSGWWRRGWRPHCTCDRRARASRTDETQD